MPFGLTINYIQDKQAHTVFSLNLFDGPYHNLVYLCVQTKGLWT